MSGYILRSNTKEEVYEFAKQVFKERLPDSLVAMTEILKTGSMMESLLPFIQELFQECRKRQDRGEKDNIRYIHFHYLLSCLLTGKYEIQINLYDQKSYLDASELYALWYPKVFFEQLEEDMQLFYKEARAELIRFDYHKYQEIKIRVYPIYLGCLGQYLTREIDQIIGLDEFKKM